MKSRIFVICLVFFLCVGIIVPVPVKAEGDYGRLIDDADLLTDGQEEKLVERLDEISEEWQCDVVVLTVPTLEYPNGKFKTPMEYADDFFDEFGYGCGENYDGVLLLRSVSPKELWISTHGSAIAVFTDSRINEIFDEMTLSVQAGDYEKAFDIYANMCEELLRYSVESESEEPGEWEKPGVWEEPFNYPFWIIISLLGGCIIGFSITGVQRSKLKSVRMRADARDYIRSGSFNITNGNDIFLYRKIDKRPIPKDTSSNGGSSTHTSSSGTTHGGGGRSI